LACKGKGTEILMSFIIKEWYLSNMAQFSSGALTRETPLPGITVSDVTSYSLYKYGHD
jgi:hypothetical protein